MVLPRPKGRKAYQSCGFIRKAKNYNGLSLSLEPRQARRVAGLPSLCQSFALFQRFGRCVFVAVHDAIRHATGLIIFPESG